jgi:site-specific DNA recombinase
MMGKIYCTCGCRRTGEGPQKGKHLYYRCSNRVKSFPLPRTCFEEGINARISDNLVWQKISELMSSKELMKEQVSRFLNCKRKITSNETNNIPSLEEKLESYKNQETKYTKAYGAGLFGLEKLKEYILPIKNQIEVINKKIQALKVEKDDDQNWDVPDDNFIESFAKRSINMLKILSFDKKREIILQAVEKITGTQKQLQVYGKIPITNYVEYKTINRGRRPSKCRQINII